MRRMEEIRIWICRRRRILAEDAAEPFRENDGQAETRAHRWQEFGCLVFGQ